MYISQQLSFKMHSNTLKLNNMEFKYDVALSFAGEDRKYVEQVAQILIDNEIKVFYDKFEEVDLWGKDLAIHFDFVYRNAARYCVPFISENYKNKIWTNHEIKTSISRAIQTNEEYILPARFDDTEIDGIRPTLGFIDLRNFTPEDFAHLVIKKLEGEPSIPLPEIEQNDEGKVFIGVNILTGQDTNVIGVGMGVSMTNILNEHRYFNEPYFKFTNPIDENGTDTLFLVEKLVPVDFPIKLEFGQPANVLYHIEPKSKHIWLKPPKDTLIKAIVTTTLGEKYESNGVSVKKVVEALSLIK